MRSTKPVGRSQPLSSHPAPDPGGATLELADAMLAAFERAAVVRAPIERCIRIADHAVRLQISAPTLAERLWPAFSGLEAPAAEDPDLTISCWDANATGVSAPRAPFSVREFLPNGMVRGHAEGRIRVTYDIWMRMITVYDRDRRHAWVCVADQSSVPLWLERAPFRTILRWWADDAALVPMHASAVATNGEAIVVAGASGSGKSTTGLACVAAGWEFIADDFCMITTGAEPMVHPVYCLAKLEPDALDRLPGLARFVVDPASEQLVVDPTSRLGQSARLRAVLLASVTSSVSTSVTPIDTNTAFRTLVEASVLEGLGAGTRTLGALAALLRTVACAQIELGSDPERVVDMMQTVLGGLP